MLHPDAVLFPGAKPLPALPACEHFAGNEKYISRALELQEQLGPVFDITCDCEDGAPAGAERSHALTVARLIGSRQNRFKRAGVRIHDPSHPASRQDVDLLIGECGSTLAYITVPKPTSYEQAAQAAEYIESRCSVAGLEQTIALHFIIEVQSALRDVFRIAALAGVEALDFGLLDFVSDHHGAVPESAMRSPGQFEHRLVVRAKAEVAAAALANGRVPTHNPCLALSAPDQVRADAIRARNDFGFLRVYSIHPAQIMPIVEAMRPSEEDVARAAEILLAAQTADWGPVAHATEMHDRASYRYFWHVLQRAEVTGTPIPAAARKAFFDHDAADRAA